MPVHVEEEDHKVLATRGPREGQCHASVPQVSSHGERLHRCPRRPRCSYYVRDACTGVHTLSPYAARARKDVRHGRCRSLSIRTWTTHQNAPDRRFGDTLSPICPIYRQYLHRKATWLPPTPPATTPNPEGTLLAKVCTAVQRPSFCFTNGVLVWITIHNHRPPDRSAEKEKLGRCCKLLGHLRPPRYPDTVWDPGIPGYMRRSTVLQCGKCRTLLSRDASAAALIGDIFQFQRSRATNTLPPWTESPSSL